MRDFKKMEGKWGKQRGKKKRRGRSEKGRGGGQEES